MNSYTLFGVLSAVLLALLPFATSRHLFQGAINAKFFLFIGGALLLAGIAAIAIYRGKQAIVLRSRPLLWSILAALGVYWLAALLGVFPERSLFADILRSSGTLFLTHLAVFAFLLGEFFTQRDWQLIRRTIALSAGLFGFLALLGNEGIGITSRLLWTNLAINGYTFGNSTFAGTFLLLALIITLIEIKKTPHSTRWRYGLLGAAFLIFFSPVLFNIGLLFGKIPLGDLASNPLLLLGSARASSATAILLMIFYGGHLLIRSYAPRVRYAQIGWGSFFIIAIVTGVALLFTPGTFVQERYIEASTAARILIWQGGFEAFKERPLLGWGGENYEQALQKHLDNRLYQDEFFGEIWFDRAHNVIVDTLVDVGVVGATASLVVVGMFVFVVYRARARGLLEEGEAALLFALPLAHFLQLQTGFDTIGSFALLGVFAGHGIWLERMMVAPQSVRVSAGTSKYYVVGAIVLITMALVSAKFVLFDELNRQYALYRIFIEDDNEEQIKLIQTATSRISSFESLRRSSLSLINGTLEAMAEGRVDTRSANAMLAQLKIYEDRYYRYLEAQPEYYRARTALAYVLSIETVLGENKLQEGMKVLKDAYALSPNNPLTPTMEALIELYGGNVQLALQKAREAVALNPRVPFTKEVLAHIEKQAQTFPTISVLRLKNL